MKVGVRLRRGAPRWEQRLTDVPLFRRCTPQDRVTIARLMDEVTVPTRSVLQHQGRMSWWWYVVRRGTAAAVRGGDLVGLLGPGEWWGEGAILARRCPEVSIVALTEMSLFVVDYQRFRVLLHRVPMVRDGLLASLAARPAAWESGKPNPPGSE